jgi:hypothetical protein
MLDLLSTLHMTLRLSSDAGDLVVGTDRHIELFALMPASQRKIGAEARL